MSALVLRSRALSLRLPWRLVLVNMALLVLIAALCLTDLFRGAYPISLSDLIAAFTGSADPVTKMILIDSRLPRIAAALGVGLAFGLAGEMVQTMLRNPLASPDIIGFSAGSAAGAVFTVAFLGSSAFVVPGALAGGFAAALLIVLLSWQRGISPGQLILIGIGVTLTLSVITDLMMTRLDTTSAAGVMKWLVGSLNARDWSLIGLLWLGLGALGAGALWQQFFLGRVALDEELALSLGMRPTKTRIVTLGLSVALVGLAVATSGPLPFVAFVAGPIAHGLNGASRPTLFSAALVGAAVTLLADMASQSLPSGYALPTGVFTTLIGAPVLIIVLIAYSKRRRL
ncbi:MAG: iron ABC transporter permease [Pseudomonadota bacterium]